MTNEAGIGYSVSSLQQARCASSATVGGTRDRVCAGVRRNAVVHFAPVSDAFSVDAFMNVLSIDICSRLYEREVQFSEGLMCNGYQCWRRRRAPRGEKSLIWRGRLRYGGRECNQRCGHLETLEVGGARSFERPFSASSQANRARAILSYNASSA